MTLLPRILAGLALGLAVLADLPMPLWPLWELRFAAIETRALPVLLGLVGAGLALRAGDGRWALAGVLGAGVAGLPLVAALRFAAQSGDPISLRSYLIGYPDAGVSVTRDVALSPVWPDLRVDVYKGGAPWVMVIHGGSWQHGDKGEVPSVSKGLASAGYTVFDLRYRLAPASPFPAALEDVLNAICAVQTQAATWGIDPARGALLGRSAGGHLALLAANAPDTLRPICAGPNLPLKAVVSVYAPVDLAWSYANPPFPDVLNTHDTLRAFLGASADQAPATYALASPNLHVSAQSPPALLIHGQDDRLVRLAHLGFMTEAMNKAGRPVRSVEIPAADHGFDVRSGGIGEQIARAEILRFLSAKL